MKTFTGWEYLLIDIANQYGKDKDLFEERIQWAKDNLNNFEALYAAKIKEDEGLPNDKKWKEAPLYVAAMVAIRKTQQGIPTGHKVGLDATCSGIQVMSCLTGCISGADATGLVDPNRRADAYTQTTQVMNGILQAVIEISRKDAKQALMTSFYGSKATPKAVFGEDTPELNAFYQAAYQVAPGAWELLQDLLASWRPYALEHAWKMPDGYDVRIKVMNKVETRVEVDELDHATFTYEYMENKGSKSGLSNAANATHSMDAYVLRSMHRRCNYNREVAEYAANLFQIEMMERSMGTKQFNSEEIGGKIGYYIEQYERSTLADIVILPYLNDHNISYLSDEHIEKLASIVNGMLQYQPFELVTIHDEFQAHPNNLNWVRWQYKEILADIADSNVLDDLLSQIFGEAGTFQKLSNNLGDLIRESNYALC